MAEQVNLRHVRTGVSQFLKIRIPQLVAGVMLMLAGSLLPAQVRIINGAPAQPNRPLNIPPSVTSIENHMGPFLPNTPASVTSISPFNFNTRPFVNSPVHGFRGRNGCRGRGCGFSGYGYGGYGYGYAVPYDYLYPSDDSGYYGEGSSGPYLYSGPPQGSTPPAEQTLHIIVDSAPPKYAPRDDIAEQQPERVAPAPMPDAKPGAPTILVFRDGHKQNVTNYAIMGQTVYIFDDRTKKVALADLDVPATVKANDDQGVEFQVPKGKQSSRPAKPGVPLQSAPDDTPKTSSSMTSTP